MVVRWRLGGGGVGSQLKLMGPFSDFQMSHMCVITLNICFGSTISSINPKPNTLII